jgi:hypothetical protein
LEAIEDFLSRVAKGESTESCVIEQLRDAPSEASLSGRHGAIELSLRQPLANARLVLDVAWCDRFIPLVPWRQSRPLSTRKSAVGGARVGVVARVDLGLLSLSDSIGLKVGEVLVADAKPDAAIRLFCADRHVATGDLLQQSGRRAVRLSTVSVG